MNSETVTFPQTYQLQYNFHFDETRRLLELARALPDDVYRAGNSYSHESLHNTFAHILGADYFWRCVISGLPVEDRGPEDFAGIDGLVELLEQERSAWLEMLSGLDEAALLGVIERPSPYGMQVFTVWKLVQHVILHGMVHLTELARTLTEAGISPGDIDFLDYAG